MLCINCKSDDDPRKQRQTEKILLVERTTKKKLEVWLCPYCDGKALNFAATENQSPEP